MEAAGLENKIAGPVRRELQLIAQQEAVVMRRGGEPGRRQRALVHQIVLAPVQIEGAAQEPMGTLRLRNVQARRRENVMEGRCHRGWHSDRSYTGNLS